jgi:hypothetical protein
MTVYVGLDAASGIGVDLLKAAFGVLLASILAWAIGTRIAYRWEDIKRHRESDLAACKEFYRVYGEFFATWKLWETYLRYPDISKPEDARWLLLGKASSAEAGFEALLVKLASERTLDDDAMRLIPCFRQAYQQLRERMRKNQPLEWWTRSDPLTRPYREYRAFKALAAYFAAQLASEQPRRGLLRHSRNPGQGDAIMTLLHVTADVEDWLIVAERCLQNARLWSDEQRG